MAPELQRQQDLLSSPAMIQLRQDLEASATFRARVVESYTAVASWIESLAVDIHTVEEHAKTILKAATPGLMSTPPLVPEYYLEPRVFMPPTTYFAVRDCEPTVEPTIARPEVKRPIGFSR